MNLHLLAQNYANANCTINGEPADCGDTLRILGYIFVPLAIIGLVMFVFWIISLVHVIKNDVNNRTMWIILLILFGGFAGIAYFFAVRRPYNKNKGSAPAKVAPPMPVAPVQPEEMAAPVSKAMNDVQAVSQPTVNPTTEASPPPASVESPEEVSAEIPAETKDDISVDESAKVNESSEGSLDKDSSIEPDETAGPSSGESTPLDESLPSSDNKDNN